MTERTAQLSDEGVAIWLDDLSRERLRTGNLAATDRATSTSSGSPRTRRSSSKAISDGERVRRTSARPRGPQGDRRGSRPHDHHVRRAVAPATCCAPVYDAHRPPGRPGLHRGRPAAGQRRHRGDDRRGRRSCGGSSTGPTCSSRSRRRGAGLPAIAQHPRAGHQRQRHADLLARALPRGHGRIPDRSGGGASSAGTTSRTIALRRLVLRQPGRHRDRQATGQDRHRGGQGAARQGRASPTRGSPTRRTRRCSPASAGRPWRAAGAKPQRPLWASTGVKDPAYDDTLYVVELVAPGTVNTMPEATLDAVADHGVIRGDTVSHDVRGRAAGDGRPRGARHRHGRRRPGARGRGRREVRIDSWSELLGRPVETASSRRRGGLTRAMHERNPLRDPRGPAAAPHRRAVRAGHLRRDRRLVPQEADAGDLRPGQPRSAAAGLRPRRLRSPGLGRPGLRAGRPRVGEGARPDAVPRRGLATSWPRGSGSSRATSPTTRPSTSCARPSTTWTPSQGTGGNLAFYLSVPPKFFPDVSAAAEGALRSPTAHPGPGAGSSSRSRSATTWRARRSSTGSSTRSSRAAASSGSTTTSARRRSRTSSRSGSPTPLYEPIWNGNYVDHVQITMAEDIGIGGRAGYYDGIGAARDVIQNHLLQLLALIAMEEPVSFERRGAARGEGEGAVRGAAAGRPGQAHRARPVRRRLAGRHPGARVPRGGGHRRRPRRPRPTPRSGWTSTPAAGPGCRSTCGPASGSAGG